MTALLVQASAGGNMPIRALLACCGVGTRPISIIDLGNSCMAP
ncbi:hypothetical protein HanHA300_Chr00c1155g0843081 [Helianthus annuus]|nr:hypothetical protein HanHA300_Chr00c1155g0843081 [Helianthus annuus]KAJ0629964.1 hypothetical protein HanHA89_Chr00c01g0732861 [Helianthus annuus]KAJ0807786.1 hypothetical protein HanLR1_Chr00c1078g0789041 [Helianthus annuus]